jgi:hypothetical protein
MKRFLPIFLILFLLSACFPGQDAPPPQPTPTGTATPLSTSTPVSPTPTFTPTPTLVGFIAPTATPEDTATPIASVTPLGMLTPPTPTPTIQMDGFLTISYSTPSFYKGSLCNPSTVSFRVQVADPAEVSEVRFFTRFKSMTAERYGKWTNLGMESFGSGTFLFDLSSDKIFEEQYFTTAWVQYQLVAITSSGKEVGRTEVFTENLTMLECTPAPTWTPATVKP